VQSVSRQVRGQAGGRVQVVAEIQGVVWAPVFVQVQDLTRDQVWEQIWWQVLHPVREQVRAER
jgi:hypothetical protein